MDEQVCVLTSVHYPYDTRIFDKQMKSLAEGGYRVTLIARGERDTSIHIPENIKINLLTEPDNRIGRFIGLLPFMREAIREDADVYHIHDPELLLIVPVLKLTTDAAIIYDVHEDVRAQISKKDWIPEVLKPVFRFGFNITESLILPFIDEIILAEDSYQTKARYQDSHIVRNYPKLIDPPDSPKEKTEDEITELVYIGGISRPRGAIEIIELVDELNDDDRYIQFTFIGDFSSREFREEVMSEIEKREINHLIEFTGRLPFNKAIERVAQADIGYALLHKEPNFIDSIPTKLFEYMMCGIPVVISDVDQWKKIVTDHKCGIAVAPTDIEEIVKATEFLIDNEVGRNQLGKNGRNAVEAKFRWEKESETLISVYGNLLKVN